RAVSAAVGVAPGDRCAGRPAFERIHFGGIGPALVFVVERGADAVADQRADAGADQGAGHMAADTAAKLRADRGATKCTHQRAGVFFRASAVVRVARAGTKRRAKANDDKKTRAN